MNSRKSKRTIGLVFCGAVVLHLASAARLAGYEIFIYRQVDKKEAVSLTGRLTMHGEVFGQFQSPSSYPSYNDLSGPIDRWTYGFQDRVLITPTTKLLIQLVTHDSGRERTKFDWRFALRQEIVRSVVLVLGHDSEHDSDHTSYLGGKSFYTNRNYVGVGVPLEREGFLIEPFVRLFHHTNQPTRLDLTGDTLKQETGLRIGARLSQAVTLSFQTLIQSSEVFNLAQTWMADVVLRCRLTAWLEVTLGGSIWQDWGTDPAGGKQTFSKIIWGIAVPF